MTKKYKVDTLSGGAGAIITGDLEDYYKDRDKQITDSFNKFWGNEDYTYMSMDLAVLGCKKLWTGLEKTYYGHRLWPIMYDTRGGVGERIAEKNGNTLYIVMLQIWKGSKNVMFGITQEEIDDAGFNWERKDLLAKDDLINRGISALRLKEHPIIAPIIIDQYMHKRSREQDVDGATLHRVWD